MEKMMPQSNLTLKIWLVPVALIMTTALAIAQVKGPNPSSSPSNVSYTLHDPLSSPDADMVNSCNGETVTLNGELVYSYHQETKPNGDVHVVTDAVTNLTGIGQNT